MISFNFPLSPYTRIFAFASLLFTIPASAPVLAFLACRNANDLLPNTRVESLANFLQTYLHSIREWNAVTCSECSTPASAAAIARRLSFTLLSASWIS